MATPWPWRMSGRCGGWQAYRLRCGKKSLWDFDAENDGIEWEVNYNGWWFETFVIFHIIWDNPSHWMPLTFIFFKMVIAPPTSIWWDENAGNIWKLQDFDENISFGLMAELCGEDENCEILKIMGLNGRWYEWSIMMYLMRIATRTSILLHGSLVAASVGPTWHIMAPSDQKHKTSLIRS